MGCIDDFHNCKLGKLIEQDEFQSRLSQSKFTDIYNKHVIFHSKADDLIRLITDHLDRDQLIKAQQELEQCSAELIQSFEDAKKLW